VRQGAGLACLAARGRGRGPSPDLTDEEMRVQLDQLPTWTLQQKAEANRQVVAVNRGRLERGEPVARMYGPLGLAYLDRQAELAEQLVRPPRFRPEWADEGGPSTGSQSARRTPT
jgi:hypothetical protein